MELEVKLEAFEGPLDLLLHLIEKNKVDIYDIPIVEITEQYLDYVSKMPKDDLDLASEFLVMAATLIDIKSKMLLPKEIDENGEEIDPRAELVEKLIEYKMYKYASVELRDMQVYAGKSLYKEPTIPEEVSKYQQPVDLDQLLEGVDLSKLNEIFQMVLKRQVDKIDPVRSKFGKIEMEEVSLPDKMDFVTDALKKRKRCSFKQLLEQQSSKMEVIVPGKTLSEVSKILPGEAKDTVNLYLTDKHILFEFGDTKVVSRLLEGKFYNIGQMLSNDYETKLTINKMELLRCLDRSTLFVKESDKKPIILKIENEQMNLMISSQIGSMKDQISISKEGKDIVIGFNPKFLVDALRVIDEEEVTIYLMNSIAPCIIRDETSSYLYLILPINVSNSNV